MTVWDRGALRRQTTEQSPQSVHFLGVSERQGRWNEQSVEWWRGDSIEGQAVKERHDKI